MRHRHIRNALACLAASLILSAATTEAGKFNKRLNAGDPAPVWKDLKGIDDKPHSLAELKDAKAVVVVFICNHCPVAQSYESRFAEFVKKYDAKGVKFVALSCSQLPQDGFEKMKQRATERKFNFPYLHDADQSIAKSYGATATPHVFVLDGERRIAYMGAFDDNMSESKVKTHYVLDAVDAVLEGKRPEIRETRQFGCEIDYDE